MSSEKHVGTFCNTWAGLAKDIGLYQRKDYSGVCDQHENYCEGDSGLCPE
jgi:hypothetical protein